MSAVPTARVPLRIDFVSDVVCPWCAIGLAALEQALARLPAHVDVEFHVRPFELNPQMAPEGEDIAEHLARKYGMSPEQLAEGRANLQARGAEVGFSFGDRQRTWNTFDAHRLLHWAGQERLQFNLKHALLQAYHGDGENVSDHATLVRIASSVGLDAERAAAILASDEFADVVRAEEQFFIRSGINSVPATIIDQRHLISGGQPVEVFERALREILAGKVGQDGAGPS
ncbi:MULTISPECIES: DsbA family oxidoreductase [Luteimonas]|uniref:DsbA family oxidoreductase n=1 Tax=Luteimonas TaxID=83614 RepID=UPI000C7AFEBF|nr:MULTISPECIES: DsbA family oxidoreductase [Luteimonas]